MRCAKCNLEIDENTMFCAMCQPEKRVQTLDESGIEAWPPETALLMTANDEIQANIVESLLKAYGIPLSRTYKGNDTFGKIVLGLTVNGIDLYVPKSAIDEAKGIIENELPEEQQMELVEALETEVQTEALKEKYEDKRRSRAWISVLLLIPGILILAGVAIYWIISNLF
jgi:uncharacterized protein (DUF697 family)